MEWIGWVVAAGFIGIVAFFTIRQMRRESAEDQSAGVISALVIPGGTTLRLTKSHLIEGYGEGKRHPIAGLVARVEEGGNVNRRFTVTRIATLGVFAAGLPKKIDDRQVYLTIEGPSTVIVNEIPVAKAPQIATQARVFAGKINQLAGAETLQVQQPTALSGNPAAPESPSRGADSVASKIRQLAELHREGLLTDAEFETKKAQLLTQY